MKLFFFLLIAISVALSYDPSYPDAGSVYITGQSSSFCPAYVCSSSSVKSGCVTYSGSQMVMEGCVGGWYCNWINSPSSDNQYQFGQCTLKQTHYKFRKNVGDFCYQDEDCKSYYCISNRCSTKAAGATCTSSYQCNKGLFCDSVDDVCATWYQDGASCKDHPSLCKPTSGCVSIDSADPVCTALYSVTSSYITNVWYGRFQSNRQDYCVSGSITSAGACAGSSYTLSGGYPKTCSYSNTDCLAAGDTTYSGCNCWPNTEGVKYCGPFSGDVPTTFARIKSRYLRDFSNCYYFDMAYNWNDCGAFDFDTDRDWSPQSKLNQWGSCFDGVGLKYTKTVSTYYFSSSYSCPSLKCNTGNNEDGDCLHYVEGSNAFYVQQCPSDYICGTTYTGSYSVTPKYDIPCTYGRYRSRLAHKGEGCWADGDCFSGDCDVSKVCNAKSLGASCDSHNECDRGLMCAYTSSSSSSTCQNWIEVNGACNTDNYYLCRPGTYCIASSSGVTSGTCRAMYSGPGGEAIYRVTSGGSYQTGSDLYCASGSYDSLSNTCFSSSSTLSSYPQTCTVSSDCKTTNYKEGNYEYTSCHCFPNTQGQKYCTVPTANIDANFFNDVKNYYSRDLSNCFYYELGNSYGGSCEFGERNIDVWAASIPSQYFPSCGRGVLYSEYYYNKYDYPNIIYRYVFAARLLSFISILLAILLLK